MGEARIIDAVDPEVFGRGHATARNVVLAERAVATLIERA
jgi:hypothetical protein